LKSAFLVAIENGRMIMVDKLLSYMPELQTYIDSAFDNAVTFQDTAKFDQLLPYIDPVNYRLQQIFMNAIENNDADMFNKIFDHIKSTPLALKSALVKAVEVNDTDRFNKIFDLIKSNPDALELGALESAFREAFKEGKEAMFDKMLPYISPDASAMKQALANAVEVNYTDRFNKVFYYIKSNPNALESAFRRAIKNGDEAMFNKMLTYIMKVTPYLVLDVFNIASEYSNKMYCKQILMATDDITVFSNSDIVKLAKEDGELFINMLEKGKVNNPKLAEGLMVVLPDMLANPAVKQKLMNSGNKDILDRIRKTEGVKMHIASSPEVTSASPVIIPSLTAPGYKRQALPDSGATQSSNTASVPPIPETHGTLTLLGLAAAKVTGAKLPGGTPAVVQTQPVFKGYVDQENTTESLPPPSTVLREPEHTSQSTAQDWPAAPPSKPNMGDVDEMPELVGAEEPVTFSKRVEHAKPKAPEKSIGAKHAERVKHVEPKTPEQLKASKPLNEGRSSTTKSEGRGF